MCQAKLYIIFLSSRAKEQHKKVKKKTNVMNLQMFFNQWLNTDATYV